MRTSIRSLCLAVFILSATLQVAHGQLLLNDSLLPATVFPNVARNETIITIHCQCFLGVNTTFEEPIAPKLAPDYQRLHPIASFKIDGQERIDPFNAQPSEALRSISKFALSEVDVVTANVHPDSTYSDSPDLSRASDTVVKDSNPAMTRPSQDSLIRSEWLGYEAAGLELRHEEFANPVLLTLNGPYPNPATSQTSYVNLDIQLGLESSIDAVVYDQLGRELERQTLTGLIGERKTLRFTRPSAAGVYYVRVSTPTTNAVRSFQDIR